MALCVIGHFEISFPVLFYPYGVTCHAEDVRQVLDDQDFLRLQG